MEPDAPLDPQPPPDLPEVTEHVLCDLERRLDIDLLQFGVMAGSLSQGDFGVQFRLLLCIDLVRDDSLQELLKEYRTLLFQLLQLPLMPLPFSPQFEKTLFRTTTPGAIVMPFRQPSNVLL